MAPSLAPVGDGARAPGRLPRPGEIRSPM